MVFLYFSKNSKYFVTLPSLSSQNFDLLFYTRLICSFTPDFPSSGWHEVLPGQMPRIWKEHNVFNLFILLLLGDWVHGLLAITEEFLNSIVNASFSWRLWSWIPKLKFWVSNIFKYMNQDFYETEIVTAIIKIICNFHVT